MLAILTPKDTSRPAPPLHVLVRENPDVSCSNCISKGIRCTTNQIVNPAKPNKGGKRIEEAKKMYGSDGSALTPPSAGSEQQTPLPMSTTPAPRAGSVTQENDTGSSMQYNSAGVDTASFGIGFDVSGAHNGVFPSSEDPYDSNNQDGLSSDATGGHLGGVVNPSSLETSVPLKPWHVEWGSTALSTPFGTPFAGGMYDSTLVQDPLSWKSFVSPPTPIGTSGATSSPSAGQSSLAPTLDAAYQNAFTYTDYRPSNSPLPYSMSSSLPAPAPLIDSYSDGSRTERFGSTGETFAYSFPAAYNRSGQGQNSSPPPQIAGRKRTLSKDADALFRLEELDESASNPWAYGPDAVTDRSVRWTRREQVAERLADRALESELSRHLVRVYFQAVHFTLPGVSPESFFLEWRRSGERSDRMDPPQEVLCAVLEAWAARFSDHPVVGCGVFEQADSF